MEFKHLKVAVLKPRNSHPATDEELSPPLHSKA